MFYPACPNCRSKNVESNEPDSIEYANRHGAQWARSQAAMGHPHPWVKALTVAITVGRQVYKRTGWRREALHQLRSHFPLNRPAIARVAVFFRRTVMCCPGCQSDEAVSNLIDEAPYREVAQRAWMLRQSDRADQAADALSRLAGVQISNFLRPKLLCLICGVTYDD